jgi:hypothetical protein
MKKKHIKKLNLNKSTVNSLTHPQAGKIYGGSFPNDCVTSPPNCKKSYPNDCVTILTNNCTNALPSCPNDCVTAFCC